jgi:AcrR family transcriptional regulator
MGEVEAKPDQHRPPDRAATEAALEAAALRLLERDGVLSGLNLREVAAEAGVNRGLVYHYFGSRQDLLRAALRSDARRRFAEVAESANLPFRSRFARFLVTMVRHRRAVKLVTLLVQDGDTSLRTMPLREGTHHVLARDVEQGHLDDVDLDAVHIATVSLAYGYVLYRERFAAELGVGVTELDRRFAAIADRMLSGLEPQ